MPIEADLLKLTPKPFVRDCGVAIHKIIYNLWNAKVGGANKRNLPYGKLPLVSTERGH